MNNGKELENEVFGMIDGLVQNGDLPVRPEYCRTFRTKSYFSKRRNANVNFENVIEVYTKESFSATEAKPSLVLILECKDHQRCIEIAAIEELIGRIDQDFGFAIKAYLVTRSGFSKSAIHSAGQRGIGLIKLMDESKVSVVLYHITPDLMQSISDKFPERVNAAFSAAEYVSHNENFYGMDVGYVFQSLDIMLAEEIRKIKSS